MADVVALIRRKAADEVFDYQVIMDALSGYRKPGMPSPVYCSKDPSCASRRGCIASVRPIGGSHFVGIHSQPYIWPILRKSRVCHVLPWPDPRACIHGYFRHRQPIKDIRHAPGAVLLQNA